MIIPTDRPAALLDADRCRSNIRRMAGKAGQLGLEFRPHFKTHQSGEVGNWYREAGVTACTVSSAGMAVYFRNHGWRDITIAFPATPSHFEAVSRLAEECELRIFLNDSYSAETYAGRMEVPVKVYIEVDAGYGRTGVEAGNHRLTDEIAGILEDAPALDFHGFYVHEGRTYSASRPDGIAAVAEPVMQTLAGLRERYPGSRICMGDTPSASVLESFPDVDELSPGNHVFYDLMQLGIGSCEPGDLALAVRCPVVQVKPDRGELVIQGGAVHFSKEALQSGGRTIYGRALALGEEGFGELEEDVFLVALSQEHGTLKASREWISRYRPGDTVAVLPVHSCLTANLFDRYFSTDGKVTKKRVLS